MLIKSADDKQPDINALEALLAQPTIDPATKAKIELGLKTIRAGVKGERDAAYEIDFEFAKAPNRMVIHDLRLEIDGRVAQIDHLIIDRFLTVWVCESKHFAEGVGINEQGEWVAWYGARPQGIPSPIEQNVRHVAVLKNVFDQKLIEPKKRLGVTIKPDFKSVILVSNNARISRPKTKAGAAAVDGLDSVMKLEKLRSAIANERESRSVAIIARAVSSDTIERLGRDLVALHRPVAFDWAARIGLVNQVAAPTADSAREPVRGLPRICESCGALISYGVARYSAEHAERYSGRILCMTCQKAATS